MYSIYRKLKNILKNVEIPKNHKYGNFSSNIFKNNLVDEEIIKKVEQIEYIERTEIIDGFLNIYVNVNYLKKIPLQILAEEKKTILIEGVSPNPTGKIHAGHIRNIFVCKLVNFLRFLGHDVIFELYINDVGNQISEFISSIEYKIREKKGLSLDGYKLYYKNKEIDFLSEKFLEEKLDEKKIIKYVVETIKDDIKKLDIIHDTTVFESELFEFFEKVRKILEDKLEVGKLKCVYEEYETNKDHLLLKISEDKKFVIVKENKIDKWKEYSYVGRDLAYFIFKVERLKDKKNPLLIYVLGEDHHLHITRLQESFKLLNPKIPTLFIEYAFVSLKGKKLSKRQGNIFSIDDMLKIMNKNSLGFVFLSSGYGKTLNIDLENIHLFIEWDVKLQLAKNSILAILNLNKAEDFPFYGLVLKKIKEENILADNKTINLLLEWEILLENIIDVHLACVYLKKLINESLELIQEEKTSKLVLCEIYNRFLILEKLLFN